MPTFGKDFFKRHKKICFSGESVKKTYPTTGFNLSVSMALIRAYRKYLDLNFLLSHEQIAQDLYLVTLCMPFLSTADAQHYMLSDADVQTVQSELNAFTHDSLHPFLLPVLESNSFLSDFLVFCADVNASNVFFDASNKIHLLDMEAFSFVFLDVSGAPVPLSKIKCMSEVRMHLLPFCGSFNNRIFPKECYLVW